MKRRLTSTSSTPNIQQKEARCRWGPNSIPIRTPLAQSRIAIQGRKCTYSRWSIGLHRIEQRQSRFAMDTSPTLMYRSMDKGVSHKKANVRG